MNMKNRKLFEHEQTLRREVFFTEKKWPHFDILFKNIKQISKKLKRDSVIVSLERGNLYGNISLLAPFFENKKFISVDCSGKEILKRGSYNKKYVSNKKIIKIPIDYHFDHKRIKLKKNLADCVIIPNLIHHINDHDKLFKQIKKILKKNGFLYIFEPLLRELHQIPEDYLRYTPYGLEYKLKKFGFKKFKSQVSGGPFTAIAYCWDQALQYIPKNIRDKKTKWFYKKHFKSLITMEKKYKKNLVRKNTSFPVSFSLTAYK